MSLKCVGVSAYIKKTSCHIKCWCKVLSPTANVTSEVAGLKQTYVCSTFAAGSLSYFYLYNAAQVWKLVCYTVMCTWRHFPALAFSWQPYLRSLFSKKYLVLLEIFPRDGIIWGISLSCIMDFFFCPAWLGRACFGSVLRVEGCLTRGLHRGVRLHKPKIIKMICPGVWTPDFCRMFS